ncbi:hypothetical protein AQUCO_00901099v1 [Aquilegia coerulea]|uniref:Receptor-like serine/threonine-protein kinase n=1 Tax=Aquilegia coerulea TaxID=218851 RepID=A0A2G5EGS4_AQUCA|nr:hypothetical protein AQUCO_00901099v1 [Aquilegia coerulea]
MKPRRQTWLSVVMFFFFYSSTSLTHLYCFAADTISLRQSLTFNQTLISKGGKFELGYFTPSADNSLNYYYYIGIWYKDVSVRNKTVVWVANRDTPLTGDDLTSSELKLLENGILALFYQLRIVWSSTDQSTSNAIVSSKAVLRDDGNLVLMRTGVRPSDIIWQSFDYPTDTLLPGAKLGYDITTKKVFSLTSWRSPHDPAKGLYSGQLDRYGDELFIQSKEKNNRSWSSGRWNGEIFSLVPEMRLVYNLNYRYVKNENESYFTYYVYNSSIPFRLVMDFSGQIKHFEWVESSQSWNLFWSQPLQYPCEVYGYCSGPFSVCDQDNLPLCRCLNGFIPESPNEWNLSAYSHGCVRNTYLQCGDEVGFLQDYQQFGFFNQRSYDAIKTTDECKQFCLDDCSCNAYSFNSSCLLWKRDVFARQPLQEYEGQPPLHIQLRVAGTEILRPTSETRRQTSGGQKPLKAYIIVLIAGSIFVGIFSCSLFAYKRKQIGKLIFETTETSLADLSRSVEPHEPEQGKLELPLFDFNTVATATNNFSNKLGQGGFGSVYKGKLLDEREIAVKRLSTSSGQGEQEFKNELMLISKLQHRNLVRLLGYCISRKEKILLYEYMPNKSLDAFLFDPTKRNLLDWSKRFSIIDGIARGLLYLHRDSRLKVIHRDLKASNVLLDEDMNPKISDFGMARIFGGKQTLANTNRVVGTYGYMSPEYAMEGIFSEKSDVFSFGVLLLEIVTSKKNTNFYLLEESCNLLGYVYQKYRNENNLLDIMDPTLVESYNSQELMRCIHIGLLCVQDHAVDRPTMSAVVSMLGSEGTLPLPKQPAFTIERKQFSDIFFNSSDAVSLNSVTITNPEGR